MLIFHYRLPTFVTLCEIFRPGKMLCCPDRLQSSKPGYSALQQQFISTRRFGGGMHRFLTASCLFFGVMLAASAEKPQLLCLQSQNTLAEAECLNQELRKEDKILSDYLTTAQGRIDKESSGKPQIAASQEAWRKYRDAQCGDVYAYEEGGRYRYRAELECRIEATRSRTHAIWSAYIRMFGTDVPALPEPDWYQKKTSG